MKTIPAKNGGLRVLAPAKINLFFEILFKRSDGYHEIETLVAPISLYDELEIKILNRGENSIFRCVDELGNAVADVPTDARNLVWRAADAFFDEIGEKAPLSVEILKKIPTKAGLGGGSSDAAATLSVLNALSGVPLSRERLRRIGETLGSDVSLFFENGASFGRGRGELVEPFELPAIWLVVLKPRDGLSTPDVFRRYSEAPPTAKRSSTAFLAAIDAAKSGATAEKSVAATVAAGMSNRLEDVARTFWPEAARLAARLRATPDVLGVQMTGSGSAFFALYPDETSARAAAARLRDAPTDDKIFATKTLLPADFD